MSDLLIVRETDVGVISTTEPGLLTVQEVLGDVIVTEGEGTVVLTSENVTEVVEHVDTTTVFVTGGEQGPPGIQGTAGAAFLVYRASGPVSGHRIMRPVGNGFAAYADSATPAHGNAVIGISMNAASDGDAVNIQFSGDMTEPSWAWVPGLPVFCGSGGSMTQVPPVAGFQLIVGIASSPTSIVVGIKQPILV